MVITSEYFDQVIERRGSCAIKWDRPMADVRILSIRPNPELNEIERQNELSGTKFAEEKTE